MRLDIESTIVMLYKEFQGGHFFAVTYFMKKALVSQGGRLHLYYYG